MSNAVPIGTNTLTAITRRYVMPEIVDNFFLSNAFWYRMNASNRKLVQGGTQYEQPLYKSDFTSAGWYEGFDQLDTTPQDVLMNAAWGWNYLNVNVTIDGGTMLKNDSPESIANIARTYFEIARMKAEDLWGTALFSTGSDPKQPQGLRGAIDDGTVLATYGGIGSRTTTNSFWQPATGALDTTTAALTLGVLQSTFQATVQGSRNPTLGVTTNANYNRYVALTQPQQRYPTQPGGADEQLASAGFTNILFNNVPVVVDSHCPANHWFWLNETYWKLIMHPGRDFYLGEFQRPINQDAYVAPIFCMGLLACANVSRQSKLSALAA